MNPLPGESRDLTLDEIKAINADPQTSFELAPWHDRRSGCSWCHARNGGRALYVTNRNTSVHMAICLSCAEMAALVAEEALE